MRKTCRPPLCVNSRLNLEENDLATTELPFVLEGQHVSQAARWHTYLGRKFVGDIGQPFAYVEHLVSVMPLCGAALSWRFIEHPQDVCSWDFNESCKVSCAVARESPFTLVSCARGATLSSPPLRRIATNPLSSLPTSVDVISHSTQPRLRSQHWIPCGAVFGPRAYFHSSCALLARRFPFNSRPLLLFSFTHRHVLCSSFARSARTFTFSSDVLSSPFS